MKPTSLYLCMSCRKDYEDAYKLTEIPPLPGIPFRPDSKPCENCKKKRIGMWYRIESKDE